MDARTLPGDAICPPDAPLTIGNAQAFWGDDPAAPARLVAQWPTLDFLTLD